MGKFEVKKGKNDQYYFNLKANNGQVILSSEGYSSKSNCLKGIESVKVNGNAAQFEKSTASNGKFYFTLKAKNAQVIGQSQMYTTESSRDNGISSVISNAAEARSEKRRVGKKGVSTG